MFVKLKCVDNADYLGVVSTYLTSGEVYDAIMSKNDEIALLCDNGVLINDSLYEPIHARWEIVSE